MIMDKLEATAFKTEIITVGRQHIQSRHFQKKWILKSNDFKAQ
jgi:hypothetical protein